MARFKNVSGNDLSLFAEPGEANSYLVAVDEIVTLPGECTNADDKDADAYTIVGPDGTTKMMSKAAWSLTVAHENDPADTGTTTTPRGRRTSNSGSGDTAEPGTEG